MEGCTATISSWQPRRINCIQLHDRHADRQRAGRLQVNQLRLARAKDGIGALGHSSTASYGDANQYQPDGHVDNEARILFVEEMRAECTYHEADQPESGVPRCSREQETDGTQQFNGGYGECGSGGGCALSRRCCCVDSARLRSNLARASSVVISRRVSTQSRIFLH